MEITRAYDGDGEKKKADPSVECYAHSLEHDGLTNGTYKGQAVADEVEFRNLGGLGQYPAHVAHDSVKRNVKPAANGIIGRILPGLEAIAMGEVMGRLPVVEGLVAVLDWGKQSSNHAGSEKEIERRDGLHGICARPFFLGVAGGGMFIR